MKLFNTLRYVFVSSLASPGRIFLICLVVIAVNMLFKGGLFELLSLRQNLKKVNIKKQEIKKEIAELDMKILRSSDPEFLELEVLNRFDLAQEGDLIFVFSDEKAHRPPEKTTKKNSLSPRAQRRISSKDLSFRARSEEPPQKTCHSERSEESPHLSNDLNFKSKQEQSSIPFKSFNLQLSLVCLLYTSPSPRDRQKSRMPSSA